jgi:hypothetical protein
MTTPTSPQVGDRVAVPWGLDTVEGVVVATYRTGEVDRVVVEISAQETGADVEPITVVLPVDEVADVGQVRRGGEWLHGFRYEREVAEAVGRVLQSWQPRVKLTQASTDKGADLIADTPFGTLIVEIKHTDRISEQAVRQLQSWLSNAMTQLAKGLLVGDGTFSESLRKQINPDGLLSPDLGIVRWRGTKDDQRLREVIHALFSLQPDE